MTRSHARTATLLPLLLAAAAAGLPAQEAPSAAGPGPMRTLVEGFVADRSALRRTWTVPMSDARRERFRRFLEGREARLDALDFDGLPLAGRVDWILLRSEVRRGLRRLEREARRDAEVAGLLPFHGTVVELGASLRRMEWLTGREAADRLHGLAAAVGRVRGELESGDAGDVAAVLADRAARRLSALRGTLREWHRFHAGYDPAFTWWTAEPYEAALSALDGYRSFLLERFVGTEDRDRVVGDPIGREALLAELRAEMIPYSPEELVGIAEREFAWCDERLLSASRRLGFGDDWRKALDHVKERFVPPGDQPALIRDLAREAETFLDEHGLVTIPDLCRETWRLRMMTPERQKVTPYFTGGEVISVSFPTDGMAHEDKLMSLRGNNVHFSRATVHHELIPGHHLQQFMLQRHRPWRRAFRTPFWIEGWALYWEMLLWDLGFPRSPEDEVGMLFWRRHRCARIVFSLRFHLGEMSAQEAIDYLVERVGHERRNATAEVRRSVGGSYPPLYQAAYMVGGLQFRALRKELVETGRMTDRAFHDAILRENAIPVELVRAILLEAPPPRDFHPTWRFAE